MRNALSQLTDSDPSGITKLRSAYGGMGSFYPKNLTATAHQRKSVIPHHNPTRLFPFSRTKFPRKSYPLALPPFRPLMCVGRCIAVIGFSSPGRWSAWCHPTVSEIFHCTLWWLCVGHLRMRRILTPGLLTFAQPPPLSFSSENWQHSP